MSPLYIVFYFIGTSAIILLLIFVFFKQSKFGRLPTGVRLDRIKSSPNYNNGQFRNELATVRIAPETSKLGVYITFLFGKKERPKPKQTLPTQKTNLFKTDLSDNLLIWLGHSSYYLQQEGIRFLVDPVLSPTASPFSFAVKAFDGTNPYSPEDFPDIDYLLITHDHWDHLNKPTLMGFKDKVKNIVCPLGVGEHLEAWGFESSKLLEGDWLDEFNLRNGITLHILPSRHFSGRSLWGESQSLWASFALISQNLKVYFGGDGGYGPHFSKIGKTFAGFDLAVLENGQYNEAWPYVHMQPEECLQAALDLGAKALLAGHSAKFVISSHPWDEPLTRISELAQQKTELRLITPIIGQPVELDNSNQQFNAWWKGIN